MPLGVGRAKAIKGGEIIGTGVPRDVSAAVPIGRDRSSMLVFGSTQISGIGQIKIAGGTERAGEQRYNKGYENRCDDEGLAAGWPLHRVSRSMPTASWEGKYIHLFNI